LKEYIAAGFDPARFWDLTPRLFVTEMEGAALRAESRRTEIWFTAMLPQLKDPPSLADFVGGKSGQRAEMVRCINAWDKIDRALAANS